MAFCPSQVIPDGSFDPVSWKNKRLIIAKAIIM
jgi:hypothetical protein